MSAETRALLMASEICLTVGRSIPHDEIFLQNGAVRRGCFMRVPVCAFGRMAVGAVRAVHGNRCAIEHEIFAFLIEHREAIQAQRIAQEIDRRLRLLDYSQERIGVGNGNGASFRAPAEVAKKKLQLLREVFRGGQFLRDFARRETGQDVASISLAMEQHSLEDVLPEIDPNDRVTALGHGAAVPCSGKRADIAAFPAFHERRCFAVALFPVQLGDFRRPNSAIRDRCRRAVAEKLTCLDDRHHFRRHHFFPSRIT